MQCKGAPATCISLEQVPACGSLLTLTAACHLDRLSARPRQVGKSTSS